VPADEPGEYADEFELWTEPSPYELPAARDDHGHRPGAQPALPAPRHAYGSVVRHTPSHGLPEQQPYWPAARESYAPAAQEPARDGYASTGRDAYGFSAQDPYEAREQYGYGYAAERTAGSARREISSGHGRTSSQDGYPAQDPYGRPEDEDPGPAQPTRFPYGPYKP
jgi:hypothetical protein